MMVYYQFYYLFFTYRWLNGELIEEPDTMAELVQGNQVYIQEGKPYLSCALHDEKRLFRILLDCDKKLTNAELNQKIYNYRKELDDYYQVGDKNDSHALLYAVSVVMIVEEQEGVNYILTMPRNESEIEFQMNSLLLTIANENETEKLYFADFQINAEKCPARERHINQWQIEFIDTERKAVISPLNDGESDSHPILQFYIITWVNQTPNTIPTFFNNKFLRGELKDASKRTWSSTFLTDTMPHLLMTHWQFAHIFLAINKVINQLDNKNSRYRQIQDVELATETLKELRETLQEMTNLEANAQYELARSEQAERTIEINIEQLTNYFYRQEKILNKEGYAVNWIRKQNNLEYFKTGESNKNMVNILSLPTYYHRELANKRTYYVEALIKHLQGSKLRWHNLVEAKEHETQESLKALGNGLIVLGATISIFRLIDLEPPLIVKYIQVVVIGLLLILSVSKTVRLFKPITRFLKNIRFLEDE